ncbi:MAG: hypothetical protein V2A34_10555, partial [Lentisphaerota bacterium]
IMFLNDKVHGLGFPLPPGTVEIFRGGQRTHHVQQAWFAHTPAQGKIWVNLGPAPDVVGLRRALGVSEAVLGSYEADFEIRVMNYRKNDIRIEITEKPSVSLEWSVIRTGKPYSLVARCLVFNPEITSGDELAVDYRLNVRRPQL